MYRIGYTFSFFFFFFFKILEITTLYPQQVMPSKITGNSCQPEQKLLSPYNSGWVSTPLHWTHRKSVRLKIERSWWLSTDNSGFVNLTSKTISAEACDVGDTFFTDKLSVAWVAVIKHFLSRPRRKNISWSVCHRKVFFLLFVGKDRSLADTIDHDDLL